MKFIFRIPFFLIILIISSCSENTADSGNNQTAEYTQIDFEPAFSPDGNIILYVHSNVNFEYSGIKLKNFISGADSLIININARCPDLSPDLKWIAYSIDNFIVKSKINGDSLRILRNTGINFYPKWNSSGEKILFADIDNINLSNKGIWLMDKNGNDAELIEQNGGFPEWKGNDNTVVFLKKFTDANGNALGDTIYEKNLNTGIKKLIYVLQGDDHRNNSYLNYINGEFIFCSTSNTGYSYIYKISAQGNLIKLTETQGWSPAVNTGKIIYTNRNPGNGRLWEMDISGNNKIQITF